MVSVLRFGIEIGERLLLRMRNDRSVTTLILGDLILDRYIEGHVRGISPEAPVPVLVQGSERDILGGAGNVANNIVALGGGRVWSVCSAKTRRETDLLN